MRQVIQPWTPILGLLPLLLGLSWLPLRSAADERAATAPAEVVNGAWQHHKLTFPPMSSQSPSPMKFGRLGVNSTGVQ